MNVLTPIANEMPAPAGTVERRFTFRETTNPDHTQFYVSAFYGGRAYLLAGPYPTHDEALARVGDVKAYAIDRDPRGFWASYGTASSNEIRDTKLGAF